MLTFGSGATHGNGDVCDNAPFELMTKKRWRPPPKYFIGAKQQKHMHLVAVKHIFLQFAVELRPQETQKDLEMLWKTQHFVHLDE